LNRELAVLEEKAAATTEKRFLFFKQENSFKTSLGET